MTTYIDITDPETDPDAPLTSELAKKWRDNAIAIAEGDATAVVNQACWHPYNMVKANDGATGVFYSGTVLATVTTPTFVDGYDYLIRWNGISHNNGSGQSFVIAGVTASGAVSNATTLVGSLEIMLPTLENYPKKGRLYNRAAVLGANDFLAWNDTVAANSNGEIGFTNAATALTSVSFTWTAGSFDSGNFWLYRRRNYISG